MQLKYDYSYHDFCYSPKSQFHLVENAESIWNLADDSNWIEQQYPFIDGHNMRQVSNIHYFVGFTALSLLASSCGVDQNTTQKTAPQNVAAQQQHSDKNTSSPAPKIAKSQPPKTDLSSSKKKIKPQLTDDNQDFEPSKSDNTDSGFTKNDRQNIRSSAAYAAVQTRGEEVYNDPAKKREHDLMCEQASVLLSTGSPDAEKVNAFCMAVDAYVKKKMTQEITESISSNTSSNETATSPDTAVIDHYRSIDNGELEKSWNNLSPSFKGSNLEKGFNEYIEWWNSVEKVYIGDVRVIKSSETKSIVKTNLSYKLRSGRIMNDNKKYIYLVSTDGTWLIDGKSETYNN